MPVGLKGGGWFPTIWLFINKANKQEREGGFV